MRKLLLASAAMVGATAGIASAQMAPSQGQTITPANPATPSSSFDGNNAYGQPSTYNGTVRYNPAAKPTPGTIVIHLGGKVEVDVDALWGSANTAQAVVGGTVKGSAKINPISIGAYMRLYPGVDGMATNGLRYGASIELRENFPGSAAQTSPNLVAAPSGSTFSSGQTVYVRRAFAYLAADNIGLVRIGTTDGVLGLFDNCAFSNQCWDAGSGIFNGGMMQAQDPAGYNPPFVWLAQAGAEYGNTKVVYLSPQFFGIDVGVQYAPSMGNGYSACAAAQSGTAAATAANNNQAASTCNATTTGSDGTRWFNQVGVGARWQGSIGPVDAGAFVFYETAGKETVFGGAVAPTLTGGTANLKYDNLSFIAAAALAKVNLPFGSLSFSVDYIGGALNGQLAMRPQGGAPENAILTGVTFNSGPLTMGLSAGFIDSQGAQQLTKVSQRHEYEIAFGGQYNLAPGLYLAAEYMYMNRHQGGFDFNTGALGTGTTATKAGLTRDIHSQGIMFATVVNW